MVPATVSVDVIIPTAGSPANLPTITNLPLPEGIVANYYVVTDRPPDALQDGRNQDVKFIRNKGLGAHSARNTGLDAGSGDYILFMDDDVLPGPELVQQYKAAIEKWPDSVGFVGSVNFPKANNPFQRGVVVSDILTFFGIAKTRPETTWGVTANLMIRREAVGPIRFSEKFPRHGGGEDIDFCLRIVQRNTKMFMTVPGAVVDHAWWGEGARQYRRFARWAYGDSRLPQLHRQYKYRNFPNMVEAAALGFCALAIAGIVEPQFSLGAWWAIASAFLIECTGETVKAARRGIGSFRTGLDSALVRLSNELGRLAGNLRRGHIGGFCERFDYFTTGESISYERKVAGAKITAFALGLLLFFLLA